MVIKKRIKKNKHKEFNVVQGVCLYLRLH